MHPRARKLLLITMSILFILIGGYVVMLSQGWIIDTRHLKIVRTGSIFLKFEPSDAKATLDERSLNLSFGILGNGALVKNLLPGTYNIEIQKPGFFPWEKILEVKPGEVTPQTHVVLWNSPLKETLLEEGVQNMWLLGNDLITKKAGKLFKENIVLRGKNVVRLHEQSKSIITDDGMGNYHLIKIENPKLSTNINELFNSLKQRVLKLPGTVGISYIEFHPFSSEKIIISTRNAVYILDTSKIELELAMNITNINSIALSQNEIFGVTASGTIELFNLSLKRGQTLPLPAPNTKEMIASKNGDYIILKTKNDNLLLLNRQSSSLHTLSSSVKNSWFSPEGKRLAYITNSNEIFIYYLEDFDLDRKYKKGEVMKLRNGNTITWLPSYLNYVLIDEGGRISIEEIDNAMPRNSYPILDNISNLILKENNLYLLTNAGVLKKALLKE